MRSTTQTVSTISDKLRDTAREADTQLRAAGETVSDGMRQSAETARASLETGAQQASEAVGTIVAGASSAGKDGYRAIASQTNETLALVEKTVARNPLTALAAALGVGLLFGLMARR